MNNFISAGEAVRSCANPFIAFLPAGETAASQQFEVTAFHDKVNNVTLVSNQTTVHSPQSGEPMTAIPNTTTKMDASTQRELASTCSLMRCRECKCNALVENELSFTIAGEEMACPQCGKPTQFSYVDDGDLSSETAAFDTLADIQAYQFTGDDDTDAEAYDGIESFILGDHSMDEKITALGVMMRAMGEDSTPTAEDVEQFIQEANNYNNGEGDFADDDDAGDDYEEDDGEFANAQPRTSFSQRFLARKYELADAMIALEKTGEDDDDDDPSSSDPESVEGATLEDAVNATLEDSVSAVVDPVAGSPTPTSDTITGDTVTGGTPIETITDADLITTGTDDTTVDPDAPNVELDDNLENVDDDFGAEKFRNEDETTVTVASLVDRSHPLTFAALDRSNREIAVFVGSHHVGTLVQRAAAETASVLYGQDRIKQAFAAAFNAHRDTFETAAELRQYGFRPVQFRINLGEVATAQVETARRAVQLEVAKRVNHAVDRRTKLLNLSMLGICKDHFKVNSALVAETAALLERAGIPNARTTVRNLFARTGPAFFAAVVEKANDLSTKSDDHLNGISEAIQDATFVGGDVDPNPAPARVVDTSPSKETANFRPVNPGPDNSQSRTDFGKLVRSISRR